MKANNKLVVAEGEILLKDITPSPFNYRRIKFPITEDSLRELADSIKKHDVLQSILVRPLEKGKYELVVGERRYGASRLAGKKSIPARIKEMTDDEVQEVQLIENLQRLDPHPMAEALAIGRLLSLTTVRKSVEDIAAEICKSTTYVYTRKKLNDLIEEFQDMFFGDALSISQALKLSALDEEAQTDFFTSYCMGWKEANWVLQSFNHRIENYQLDLSDAPFSIKDAKLDKSAGACTKCPNNTAVVTSLFPEDDTEARCTNRKCYENKCRLFNRFKIIAALKENPGMSLAVPDDTVLTQFFGNDDSLIRGRTILMEDVDFHYYREMPQKPDRSSYEDYEEEEEIEEAYNEAVADYENDLKEIDEEVKNGECQLAIMIGEGEYGDIVRLYPKGEEKAHDAGFSSYKSDFKAKDYQEAVKGKTLSIEIIQSERQRLEARERRSKELDQEKLQLAFYEAFENAEAVQSVEHARGKYDRAVAIFLIYEGLGWSAKKKIEPLLYDEENPIMDEEQQFIHFFLNATDKQVSYLTRIAILDKEQSKRPDNNCGKFLRLMVEGTVGIDAAKLVADQQLVTKEREDKLEQKFALLDKQAQKAA